MNIDKLEKKQYAAYEKFINIELFNDIITFIIDTKCNKKEAWENYKEIEKKVIWIRKRDRNIIRENYKFQYFGELLERYEERIGNDIKDFRAIALALGYAGKYIESSMIVGTQLIDFINKIRSKAGNDIYLKCALYLYDNKKYYSYSEEFMRKKYINTQEIIFSLSIFYERIDDFLKQNRKQIVDLLGKDRNMPVMGNIGIYAWVIRNLNTWIFNDRKKDISFLKALIKVPTAFQKEDTIVYKELTNNGYSNEEIAYLNYLILYYATVPKSVRLGNSVVEEKIAVNLCVALINSNNTYEKDIYDLIRKILNKYNKFDIKCNGFCNIKLAIEDKIEIINPTTFAELCYELDYNLFSFNILEKKWDIVAQIIDGEKYEKIFDKFLLRSNYNKDKLDECVNKYNELTGQKYIESFLKFDYERETVFKFLIEKNVIFLKDVFECNIKDNKQHNYRHLKEYIRGVRNKKSFEFLKYLIRLNKYTIKEISEFGFSLETLLLGGRYYGCNKYYLDIERKFLGIKEHKILFNFLEKHIFYNYPRMYLDFLESVLKTDMICKLFPKEELRRIYLALCEIYPETYKKEGFQKKYLTSVEMDKILEQKRIEKELKEQQQELENEKFVREKFDEINEKNSFKNLYKLCDCYEYNEIKIKYCIKMVKKYIFDNIDSFSKDNEEKIYFMNLLIFLMKKEKLSTQEFAEITYQYIKEEVQENECIYAAC